MQERIRLVKALFRDQGATEFIIATIPTVLGVKESSRLAHTLREEQIPCRRIIVNQIIGPGMGDRWGRWSVWVMVGGWGQEGEGWGGVGLGGQLIDRWVGAYIVLPFTIRAGSKGRNSRKLLPHHGLTHSSHRTSTPQTPPTHPPASHPLIQNTQVHFDEA